MTTYSSEENRRQAVRVSDRVLLSCRPISAERLETLVSDAAKGVSLYNQKHLAGLALYLGAHNALGRIREKDTDLAEYLQQLDTKINRVMAAVCKELSPFDSLEQADVNVSGSGVAFASSQRYLAGDHVELLLVLLPEHLHIYAVGEVISAPKMVEGDARQWRTALKFTMIMDEDKENLIQHIFRRQHLALKKKRMAEEERS